MLDVPCNTLVCDLERRPPRCRKAGCGRKPKAPFQRVDAWAKGQPGLCWMRLTVRDAEKGPLEVEAMMVRVQAKQDHRVGPEETLVVLRTVGETRIDYALANLGPDVTLPEVVGAQRQRHRIEELFQAGNGEAGLDHYEVRSWAGWHHHMTLALVALWFLCLERRRVGGKNPRDHGVAEAASVHGGLLLDLPPTYKVIAAEVSRVLRRNQGVADLSLASGNRGIPAPPYAVRIKRSPTPPVKRLQ